MTQSGPASVTLMTVGQPQPPGQDVTITRPRHHIENVRQDAIQAAKGIAAEDGGEPDQLITNTISWALGEYDQAPFTGTLTPGGATPAQIAAEIETCHTYLQSTTATESNSELVDRAHDILSVLEWLTGTND